MEKWNKNLFLLTVRKSYMVLTGKISHWGVCRKSVILVALLLQICFFSISENSPRENLIIFSWKWQAWMKTRGTTILGWKTFPLRAVDWFSFPWPVEIYIKLLASILIHHFLLATIKRNLVTFLISPQSISILDEKRRKNKNFQRKIYLC